MLTGPYSVSTQTMCHSGKWNAKYAIYCSNLPVHSIQFKSIHWRTKKISTKERKLIYGFGEISSNSIKNFSYVLTFEITSKSLGGKGTLFMICPTVMWKY